MDFSTIENNTDLNVELYRLEKKFNKIIAKIEKFNTKAAKDKNADLSKLLDTTAAKNNFKNAVDKCNNAQNFDEKKQIALSVEDFVYKIEDYAAQTLPKNIGKKVLIGLGAVVVLAGVAFGIAYAAGAFNTNNNLNLTPNGPSVNPTPSTPTGPVVTPTTPTDPGTEITDPGTGSQTDPGQVDPGTGNPTDPGQVDPGTGEPTNPETTITEAEYKALFMDELPGTIEDYFNNNIATKARHKISNLNNLTINFATGDIYFNCTQDSLNVFMKLNSNQLSNSTSFEDSYDNLNNFAFTTTNKVGVSVQDQSLANDIAAFALEQDAVTSFLSQNGISASSDYTVLNATKFNNNSGILTSSLVINMGDKIFTMDIGGPTGICNTQQEYLNKLQEGYLSKLDNFNLVDFSNLEAASASEAYTFTSSYGNFSGRVTKTNGSFTFEEMGV